MSFTGNFVPGTIRINRERLHQMLSRYNRELERLQSSLVSGGNPDYFANAFKKKLMPQLPVTATLTKQLINALLL